MGKSENGPDMLDCALLMSEIQKALACSVSVLLESAGHNGGASLYIGVIATSRKLTLEGPTWTCATRHLWPHKDHKTFEGCLYCTLTQLDADIERKRFLETIQIDA